jgi:release factor glutamine methyltransferase
MTNQTSPLEVTKNVQSLLDWASQQFAQCGFRTARLEIELLLADAISESRQYLFSHPERPIQTTELKKFLANMKRRLNYEPSAYIIGHKAFYMAEFKVTPAVLIPRPETELLVDTAIDWLRSRSNAVVNQPLRVLEIGTGSGAIAISLLQNLSNIRLMSTDIRSEALAIAEENAKKLLHAEQLSRLTLIAGKSLEPFLTPSGTSLPLQSYDLIISNPPYVPTQVINTLSPEIRQYEPLSALDGGADGLQILDELISNSSQLLPVGGALMMEFGYGQAPALGMRLTEKFPGNYEFHKDLAGIPRCLVAIKSANQVKTHA